MKRILNFSPALVLLATLAPTAQGALDLQLSYKSAIGAPTVCSAVVGTATTCAPISEDGVTVTSLSGFTNAPGSASGAFEFGSTVNITNTTGVSKTFEFWVAARDFVAPITPPPVIFSSNSSGTGVLGTSSLTLTSCVDTSNGLAPPTTPFCSSGTSLTNAPLSLIGPGGNDSDTLQTVMASLSGPFSLSQHISVTLGAGASINFTTSNILSPTPEPTSIVLLGGVLLATSLGLRRKFARNS